METRQEYRILPSAEEDLDNDPNYLAGGALRGHCVAHCFVSLNRND